MATTAIQPIEQQESNPQQVIEKYEAERKVHTSIKPISLKMEVISRYTLGQNKTLIAKELQITRNTVAAIIRECDFQHLLPGGKFGVATLIPGSVEALSHHVGRKSLKAAMYVLDKTVFTEESGKAQFTANLQVNVAIPRPNAASFQVLESAPIEKSVALLPATTTISSGSEPIIPATKRKSNRISKSK